MSSDTQKSIRRPRLVDVRAVASITPSMKRIRLGGMDLVGFAPTYPAQWVKLFVPANDGREQAGRVYTIRNFSSDHSELDLDFVIHGDGPASRWAQQARVGESVKIAGPRAGFQCRTDTGWVLLLGDETALPAIFSILESLPAGFPVRAIVEVAGPAEEQYACNLRVNAHFDLVWLHRGGVAAGTTRLLYQAATEVRLPSGPGELWVAAEAKAVHDVKTHFLTDRSIERARVHASGYWKYGVADHRNPVS